MTDAYLPLDCGVCLACDRCTTRAVLLWVLTSGKLDQRGVWKHWCERAEQRSKADDLLMRGIITRPEWETIQTGELSPDLPDPDEVIDLD